MLIKTDAALCVSWGCRAAFFDETRECPDSLLSKFLLDVEMYDKTSRNQYIVTWILRNYIRQ